MATQWVYSFGGGKAEGKAHQRELLGGKGAGLAEMTNIGLPVPGGFTITTEACAEYNTLARKWPAGLEPQVKAALAALEKSVGKKLGDAKNPLLVSVRSGAARSMPGMMETVLNLGLNDESVEAVADRSGRPRFAYDSYRRFIQMYSTVVVGLSKEVLEEKLTDLKQRIGVTLDTEVPAESLRELCDEFKAFFREQTGRDFPQDPWEQLVGAVNAVFNSWNADKAVTYRRVEKITGLKGTAVNVQQMVFGNMGDDCGTGVCFTRDPSTGENIFYGDLLINAQGEDVVAGIRTPIHLADLEAKMPEVYDQLCAIRVILETHYKDMQDLEFTMEQNKLYMLQCRTGKRTPRAAFKIAVDLATQPILTDEEAKRIGRKYLSSHYEKLASQPVLSRDEAIGRITADDIERLFYPVVDPAYPAADLDQRRLTTGINAVPGAATGEIAFSAERAEARAADGAKVLLVRKETSPEDVGGMHAAQGILTATGGKTSHAAVVARGWGKCCIVGAEQMKIDYAAKRMSINGREFSEGDQLTLDGSTGSVYAGELPLVRPDMPDEYHTLLAWCDDRRRLRVRTNADTPPDAKRAVELGAEGIGLCRTEHMFFDTEERRLAIQEMIVANDEANRRAALDKLLPFQRDDFIGIFEAMDGRPVTIRLVDPPLHEFLPKSEDQIARLSEAAGVSTEFIEHRSEQLHESNPMLGHRGCRLAITYPEILEMQVRAIIEAAAEVKRRGIPVHPEIMIPLTIDAVELSILAERVRTVAERVLAQSGTNVDYLVGTMIETPRAGLLADEIARVAEFFSFGTNDLTQMVMGLSRDDAGRFLPVYCDADRTGIFKDDPFQSLDQPGVGMLVNLAIEKGRSARPNLKVGICGEHGGESKSVKFCHRAGMDYVSCSPLRVPIARLAAAQAVIEQAASPAAKPAPAKAKPAPAKKPPAPRPAKAAARPAPAAKKARPAAKRAGKAAKRSAKKPSKKKPARTKAKKPARKKTRTKSHAMAKKPKKSKKPKKKSRRR